MFAHFDLRLMDLNWPGENGNWREIGEYSGVNYTNGRTQPKGSTFVCKCDATSAG